MSNTISLEQKFNKIFETAINLIAHRASRGPNVKFSIGDYGNPFELNKSINSALKNLSDFELKRMREIALAQSKKETFQLRKDAAYEIASRCMSLIGRKEATCQAQM